MADTRVVVAMHGYDQAQPLPWLKLIDNGDGTYSFSTQAGDPGNSFVNINTAKTTLVKTGSGRLVGLVFNKLIASSVITLYDSLAATGTKIATVANPLALLASQLNLKFDLNFTTGLTVVTSGIDDITVIYR